MRFNRKGAEYHATIHQHKTGLPWLLMFHGFMGSSRVFDPLINDLAAFCNPVTLDLLGHGNTISPSDPARFETAEQVKDISSILERLQINELYLYGYSMGGRLALQFAAANRQLLKGLILESTHCGISEPKERTERHNTDRERALAIEKDFAGFLNKWLQMPMFQPAENDLYHAVMKHQKPERMAASLRGFGAGVMPPVCEELNTLSERMLLIAGSLDQKYVEKMSEMAHLCENSVFKIIDGAAHRVHAGKPSEFVQLLNQFITENHG